jgi:hypothetical protein
MQFNNPPGKIKNMTTLPLKKSIGRSLSRLGLFLIPIVFVCFALAQSAGAVTPESKGSNPNGNMAEEETANLDISSDEANAVEDHPNRRVFRFNFQDLRQCASGNVTMGGELVVTFQNSVTRPWPKPKFVKVTAFNGTVRTGNRKLTATSVDIKDPVASVLSGSGTFKIEMIVTGPALPGGRPMRFRVLFSPNRYTFQDGLVTQFMPDRTPKVDCIN